SKAARRDKSCKQRGMAVRKIEVEQDDLSWVALGQSAYEIEGETRAARAALRGIQTHHGGLPQEHSPGRLDCRIRKHAISLIGKPAQLLDECRLARDHRVKALAVDRDQPAIGLRDYRALMS